MHTRIDFYSLGDLTTQLENLDTARQARKENRAEAWGSWLVCLSFYGNGGPLRILREQGVIPEVLIAGPGLRALVQEQQGGQEHNGKHSGGGASNHRTEKKKIGSRPVPPAHRKSSSGHIPVVRERAGESETK